MKDIAFLLASLLAVSCAWSQESDSLSQYGNGDIENFAVEGDSILTRNDDYLLESPVFGGEWGEFIPRGSIFVVHSRFLESFSGTRRPSGLAGWIWYQIEFVSPDRRDTTMGWINSASSDALRWDLAEIHLDRQYGSYNGSGNPRGWILFGALWLGLAFLVGISANNRKESRMGFFLLSLAFSPLVGFAVLLIMSKRQN